MMKPRDTLLAVFPAVGVNAATFQLLRHPADVRLANNMAGQIQFSSSTCRRLMSFAGSRLQTGPETARPAARASETRASACTR